MERVETDGVPSEFCSLSPRNQTFGLMTTERGIGACRRAVLNLVAESRGLAAVEFPCVIGESDGRDKKYELDAVSSCLYRLRNT
jgi:hypothetical protein